MCTKVDGNEVKLFPWRKRYLRLYWPRLPRDDGKLLIELSATFRVCNEVRFSPKIWGISYSLLFETLSSWRSLRLPIWGTSCVSWLLSKRKTYRLIRALICGLTLLILLLRKSSFSRHGKF